MADYGPTRTQPIPFFSVLGLPALALAGVRTRRMIAFGLDFTLVTILAMLLWTALVVGTVGFAAFFLPPLWPLVAFFYNGLTVSGRGMGTPGMRMCDLEMRAIDGAPVGFLQAGIHGVLLYLSWMFPPIFLVSLVTPDKRCLHDVLAGVVVVRRPF